jgi:hypothetical protein
MNRRRLRVHAGILALCLWSVYAWMISTPGPRDRNGNLKGADFAHLYTLGSVGLAHRAPGPDHDLYNEAAQAAITARRIPGAAGIHYIPLSSPQVSIFFAPLAILPYATALVLWLAASALLYAFCCYALWRSCPRLGDDPWTVLLVALAFPGFFHLIVWGQSSALALACFTAAFFLLRDDRPVLAGLALGCLIFKPQLGLAAAFIFAYTRAWRVLAGAILSAAGQLAVPAFYYGVDSLREWSHTMIRAFDNPFVEPRPYQTLSLRTFWTMLVPGHTSSFVLYLLSALLILAWTAAVWSQRPALPLSLRYSSLLVASALVAPHLLIYDVAILAPVFLMMSDWILAHPLHSSSPSLLSSMKLVLYLGFLAPLAGSITRWTHLQVSVVLMTALLWMIWSTSRKLAMEHAKA